MIRGHPGFGRNELKKGENFMPLPKEVMSMQNYKRWERGLPLEKEVKRVRIPPKPPVVPNELKIENIPAKEIRDLSARMRSERGPDGEIFCGWKVWIEFTDNKSLSGWMNEWTLGEFKKRIPPERSDLLGKIAL